MENYNKKKLAAISAVASLLSSEAAQPFAEKIPPLEPTQWTSWGRQQTMSHRDITQRRLIKRNK
jgi:hypothetical protein